MLTVPAAISLVVSTVALLTGIAAIAASWGPGWGSIRWFGAAALAASAYGVCAFQTTLDVSPDIRPIFGRIAGAFVSLLLVSWFLYFASSRGRRLERWERAIVVGTLVIGALWLVPGVCRTDIVFARRLGWLGVTYTTTRPTVFGQFTYALLMAVAGTLVAIAFRSWRRGEPGARVELVCVAVQLGAGMNDALAASGRIAMPYLLDVGQLVVVLGFATTAIARFISDAKALERSSNELHAAQRELVRRERLAALGELSAVVAHEVRNPVSIIFNAVATLRKESVSPAASTLIGIVNEEAERLKRVAGELLEFARPRALSVDVVIPRALVESATTAAVAGSPTPARAAVTVDIAPDVPDFAGDEHLLRQALINLVTNALQASEGAVEVRVTKARRAPLAEDLVFAVRDEGPGISPAVAERLFAPFFSTRATGSGLGLAIVRRIAEAHGGEVLWQNNPTRGATFSMRVPLELVDGKNEK